MEGRKKQGSFFVNGAENVFLLLESVMADLGLRANKVFVSEQTRSRLHCCCMQALGFDVAVPPNCHAPFEYFAAGKSHPDFQTSVSGDKRRSSHHWRMPQGVALTQLLKEVWSETFLYKRKHAWKITHHFPLHLRVCVYHRRVEQQSCCIRTTFWRHNPGLEKL